MARSDRHGRLLHPRRLQPNGLSFYTGIPQKVSEKKVGFRALDHHVGSRIHARRRFLRISQAQLADQLGLTSQQIHKYETGANRVSASQLFVLARALKVSISDFFDDLLQDPISSGPSGLPLLGEDVQALLNAYFTISNPTIRGHLLRLAQSLAADAHAFFDTQST